MGAGGIDRVSIEDFQLNLENNLKILQTQLEAGEYRPLPLLKISTNKPVSGNRILGIPAIRDRIIQHALVNLLQPVFEPTFLDCSYAYRPRRSAHKALNKVEKYIKKGCHWIFEADISSFFDSLNHQLLLKFTAKEMTDERILELIETMLSSGATTDSTGIPQGAVTSPLFSNIYLHQFDTTLLEKGYNLVRFADDFVIPTRTRAEAEGTLEYSREVLFQLSLRLNEEKTKIVNLKDGFIFLGYEFTLEGRRPSQDALCAFIKKIADLRPSKKEELKIEQGLKLQTIIHGWLNYFRLDATSHKELTKRLEAILKENPGSFPAHLALSMLYLKSDNLPGAKELINRSLTLSSDDPNLYLQRAMVSEELGMTSEAIDDYLAAFRLNPDNPDIAYRLGLHYLNKDQDKAAKYLQRAIQIDPSFAKAQYALGVIYQGWGLMGLAKRSFQEASSLDPDIANHTELEILTEREEEEFDPDSFKDEDIFLFLRLFQGREGIYAHQWIDQKNRCGYFPIREPLSDKEVSAHLSGDLTLSLYLLRSDDTVKMMVIDIDVNKNALARRSEEKGILDKAICEDAEKIRMVAEKASCPVYVEDSGYKGRHIWFFFSEPMKAGDVRRFAKEIIKKVGEPPLNIYREIFPKQDQVAKDGLGSLIKLPLGVHKGTGARCLFVDSKGKPYLDQAKFLRGIKSIAKVEMERTLRFLMPDSEIETHIENEEIKKVLDGCNVLRFLVNKAKESAHLTHSERLVLLYSLGHLGLDGKRYIHQVISHCLNYNYNYTQRWIDRLKPEIRPISCPKIRDWLSYITPGVGCYCEFKLLKGAYPSPLLYVKEGITAGLAKKPLEKVPVQDEIIKDKELKQKDLIYLQKEATDINLLVKEYIRLKMERKEIEARIKDSEIRLNQFFDIKGVDSLPTDLGRLKRIKKEDEICFMIEI